MCIFLAHNEFQNLRENFDSCESWQETWPPSFKGEKLGEDALQ